MSLRLKRALFWAHRHLGALLAPCFVLWFASGMVMAFVDDMPDLRRQPEAWEKAAPIEWAQVKVSLAQAWKRSGWKGLEDARLSMRAGRPVWDLSLGKERAAVWADDGERVPSVGPKEAARLAQAWQGHATVRYQESLNDDQWTIYAGRYAPHRPLHRLSVEDGQGTWLYLSSTTGEVVQRVTASQRFWGTLGPVVHWIYFPVVRRDHDVWSPLVITLSGAGCLLCLSGLGVGLWQLRRKAKPGSSASPYAGTLRWHHLGGLCFGVLAFTWVFSGLLSMTPFGWPWPDDTGDAPARLAGGDLHPERFTQAGKELALAWPDHFQAKRLELRQIAGQPWYLGQAGPGETWLRRGDARAQGPFLPPEEALRAWNARGTAAKASQVLSAYDDYYYSKRRTKGLPALRLDLEQGETAYIDLKQAQVDSYYSFWTRVNRWLYAGLHRWDWPALSGHLLRWYALVLSLLALGLAFSSTGLILAWRRWRASRRNTTEGR